MSQENVEIVRRGNAAFNRGDDAGFAESLHPDVEFCDLAHAADAPEMVKGAQALRSLLSAWRESFDDFRAEIKCLNSHGVPVKAIDDEGSWSYTGESQLTQEKKEKVEKDCRLEAYGGKK